MCFCVLVCSWKSVWVRQTCWRLCVITFPQLWALLHFIMPTLFDSHDEFNEWFSRDIESHAENKSAIDESEYKPRRSEKTVFIPCFSRKNIRLFAWICVICVPALNCYLCSVMCVICSAAKHDCWMFLFQTNSPDCTWSSSLSCCAESRRMWKTSSQTR